MCSVSFQVEHIQARNTLQKLPAGSFLMMILELHGLKKVTIQLSSLYMHHAGQD